MIAIYILPQKLSSFTDIYPNTQGKCDSQDPFVWIAFSYICEQQGNIEKAVEYASRAKDLVDVLNLDEIDTAQIYNDYGRTVLMNGNNQEALHYYHLAYRLVNDIEDMRVYSVLVSNLIIRMAIAGETNEKCEKILCEFRRKIQNQSIDNLLEYNNCAIIYYRQIKDEQAVFKRLKSGYFGIIGKLSHEQAEIYKVSTFRMLMNGRYIHDWFDEEIDPHFDNYADLTPMSRLKIFKEYIGILSQEEFRALFRIEKYRALYDMILDYYNEGALDDVNSCLADVESVNVYLYKELTMLKLGILKFIQKEKHIELTKQKYVDLSNKLYEAGLRIEGTYVLSVFIDECTSEYNILVRMPDWPKPMFYYKWIERVGLPPEPQKLSDQIHLSYPIIKTPMALQIHLIQEKYVFENIEKVIQEFERWKAHPAKIEMSVFITHILIWLNRKDEAKRFYQYYKEAGISELQFASWFRNWVSSYENLFDEKEKIYD